MTEKPTYEALEQRISELEGAESETELQTALADARRFREALDQVSAHVYMKDRESRYVYANRLTLELFGCSAEELVGRDDTHFFPPETVKRLREIDLSVFAGEHTSEEIVVAASAGSQQRVYWEVKTPIYAGSEHKKVWGLLGISTDITELKQAEEKLRASEGRWRSLTESSADHIMLLGLDYTIQFINRAVPGLVRDEIIGRSALEFIPADHQRGAIDCFERVLESGQPGRHETLYVDEAGKRWYFDVRIAPVTGEDGSVTGFVSSSIDITELKQADEERRNLERQVQQAQKLESLGMMAGGIAHDFNNLLVGILGNADLAYTDLPSHSPVRPLVSDIMEASHQLAALTNQMLAYSGRGHFVVEELDLSALVTDLGRLLESPLSKKVGMQLELADDLPAIMADASQLQQIVMNLITNASEAIGEDGGLVTVRTLTTECDRAFLDELQPAQTLPEGRYVTFEVSDTGCGMEEETLAKVFDPFFTTKFTGRGLGMAAVQGIVRGHNGLIVVESEPGVGTTFRVLLPSLDHRAKPSKAGASQENDWQGSGTILVVDDVEAVRDLAAAMLKRLGLTVLTASDGGEAVELFRERHGEIDCVLLDLKMPRMGGEEAFEELRKIQGDIPVILSSGYSEAESTRQFRGHGLAGFIQKPYTLTMMREKLREVLRA